MKNKKAFTLIELLIVIAIIGILAGVILVSTGAARNKAKDAAIISSANSIMKAAQVDSIAKGDYSAWSGSVWGVPSLDPAFCDSTFPSINASSRPSVIAACKAIIKNETMGGDNADNSYIYATGTTVGEYPKYSVMAWLPGAQKYYCIGSNGSSSAKTNGSVSGPGSGCGAPWSCPGCIYDPTTNGS